jgi:hypothetical protein
MRPSPPSPRPRPRPRPRTFHSLIFFQIIAALVALLTLGLTACESLRITRIEQVPPGADQGSGRPSISEEEPDLAILLTMQYYEAAALANRRLEILPSFRIAAERILVPGPEAESSALLALAEGDVFIEIAGAEPATALCDSAQIGRDGVWLSGRPVLRRGLSVVAATSAETVFFVSGQRLDVRGPHRLYSWDALPQFRSEIEGSLGGPNPLLPPAPGWLPLPDPPDAATDP